jgi:hypothetical protein
MKSCVYALENSREARRMVADLRHAGFDEEQLWLVAPADVPLETVSPEVVKEVTDAGPAMKRGVAVGGSLGLVGGLLAVSFPPAGVVLGGGAILMGTAAGASFGAFASSLAGSTVPEPLREEFQDELDQGRILLEVRLEADDDYERLDRVAASHDAKPLPH